MKEEEMKEEEIKDMSIACKSAPSTLASSFIESRW